MLSSSSYELKVMDSDGQGKKLTNYIYKVMSSTIKQHLFFNHKNSFLYREFLQYFFFASIFVYLSG